MTVALMQPAGGWGFIEAPLPSVTHWLTRFAPQDMPVLAESVAALAELALVEDQVDAHLLAETVSEDPLLTLKLLAHVGAMRRGRLGSDVETVTEALVMLGIPPFFRAFAGVQSAEDRLQGFPAALQGFRRVLRRSHRAARFAMGFAVHRMDHDVAVIHEAALLHDFAELLIWLYAPSLALEVAARQAAQPTLRTAQAQRDVLRVDLAELQQELMKAWRMPSLLVEISNDHATAPSAQVRNVQLAIRVARHSALGWDNAALPDDVRDIAALLQLGIEPTWRLLQDIDADDLPAQD